MYSTVQLFLSYSNQTCIFSTDFRQIIFMKIPPMGAHMFLAGGRTDGLDKTNSRFHAIMRTRLKMSKNILIFAVFLNIRVCVCVGKPGTTHKHVYG
jgi:hypothetical protein